MSFSIDNTSFIRSITESKLDEGVPTSTVTMHTIEFIAETITTIEESGTNVAPTDVEDTYITKSYLNYAPITTTNISASTTAADKLIPYTLNSDITITQEPTVIETSMISYTQPATDPSSSYDPVNNLYVPFIAVLIVVGASLLIVLITLCVVLKIKKRKKTVVSPTNYYFEPTFKNEKSISNSSRHSLNNKSVHDDTSFYVNSTDYNNGANMSFVVDKPEKTYYTTTFNAAATNTTPLFPPMHRSNQVYNTSSLLSPRQSIVYRQELINYGRESNQTMGRANGYRPSLHDSILIGSVTTRQNSTCSSYHTSLYSNKQDLHKMTLWDDALKDAWSTEDKQLVNPSMNGSI